MSTNSPIALRKVLLLDATASAVMGAVLVLDAPTIAASTAIPSTLLWYVGVLLLPIAAFMAIVASRALGSAAAGWSIVTGNELWVVGSLVLMFGPWITPNALGYVFIGAQAAVVAALAAFEYRALRGLSARIPAEALR
jgi:hypothetical protein